MEHRLVLMVERRDIMVTGGVNFYKVDEHLESSGMQFRDFAQKMQSEHGLKVVLDIVANHGSPAWSMPVEQPQFGELYDESGRLIADHQNKEPSQLDPAHEPLHRFYNNRGSNPPGVWDETRNLVRFSDLNEDNPEVLDYLANAYLKWIDQGVDAFRVDTIAWMPHAFWKRFSDEIRSRHPNFFMYAENFNFDPRRIAEHQRPENGGISVLDFPGRGSITNVFQSPKPA
jgi:cyclomaltodextrin glucanotransferase